MKQITIPICSYKDYYVILREVIDNFLAGIMKRVSKEIKKKDCSKVQFNNFEFLQISNIHF